MLGKLLEEIDHGQARTLTELSEKLGVSAAMLEALLSELERAGYLRRVSDSCGTACQACSDRPGCVSGNFRGWIRTEKGRGK